MKRGWGNMEHSRFLSTLPIAGPKWWDSRVWASQWNRRCTKKAGQEKKLVESDRSIDLIIFFVNADPIPVMPIPIPQFRANYTMYIIRYALAILSCHRFYHSCSLVGEGGQWRKRWWPLCYPWSTRNLNRLAPTPIPLLDPEDRANRGIQHDLCGFLLCPIEFDWKNERYISHSTL